MLIKNVYIVIHKKVYIQNVTVYKLNKKRNGERRKTGDFHLKHVSAQTLTVLKPLSWHN